MWIKEGKSYLKYLLWFEPDNKSTDKRYFSISNEQKNTFDFIKC